MSRHTSSRSRRRATWLLALLLAGSTGCQECGPLLPDGRVDGGPPPFAFDDHTEPLLRSEDAFFDLAAEGPGTSVTKFIITAFSSPLARDLLFMDAGFYTLHDEWYWFRLLNGHPIPGDSSFAPYPGHFADIPTIYDWARDQAELPLDLRWVQSGERLYSPRFYELALSDDPRNLGLGSLLFVPAREELGRPARWAFELEYSDALEHSELLVFFEMLLSSVPASIGADLAWLVRSPDQEELAQQMEAEQLPYADRILRYEDITVPGEVEVYAEGVTAGRLELFRAGESLVNAGADDLLLLEDVPDYLPPCSGLVTAAPQTPLAHINVLARNRGIPNAYLGGLLADPQLDQWARVRQPVAVRAIAPDQLDVVPLTNSQWATWRAISRPPTLVLPPVSLDDAPYTVDLEAAALSDVDHLRPLIGGKAAGFLALLAPGEVIVPELPMALTARAYAEHLAPLRDTLAAMLDEQDFRRSPRARFLVLEGEAAYDARHPSAADQSFKEGLLAEHTPDTPLGELVAGGGVKNQVRTLPLPIEAEAALEEALAERFSPFAQAQGLRFRSSSTVEDIEGFNGAGLYDSNTGWLSAEAGQRPWQDALRQTWSSYWGAEAFEERELSSIDHLAGHMAVLVHARFDDDKELSNGVFTLTLLPPDVPGQAVLEVNAQKGALSVTNPPPGSDALPEVSLVTRTDDGELVIDRLAASTEVEEGEVLLTEAQLLQLFESAEAVAEAWLDEENAGVLSAQKRRTLILDYEYREMDVGWPALKNGNNFGRRVVVKQARSLEPSLVGLPTFVQQQPFPRDVLGRARRVERRECPGAEAGLITVEAYTDPLLPPDLGYAEAPFTAFLTLDFRTEVPEVDKGPGDRLSLIHLSFAEVTHPGLVETGAWALDVEIDEAGQAGAGITGLAVSPEGELTLSLVEGGERSFALSPCQVELQHSSPEAFLDDVFAAAEEGEAED